MSAEYKPELIFYTGTKLHEALFWDDTEKLLYFVAIRNNMFYAFDPDTLEVCSYKTDGPVGGVIKSGNMLIVAEKKGIFRLDSETGEKVLIKQILPNEKIMRYNHIILDPKGRILVDVMGDEERCAGMGGLYSVSPDGKEVKILVSETTVANGMTFTRDGKKLYFTDTPTRCVMEYEYNAESGDISGGKVVVRMGEGDGSPDGVMLGHSEKTLFVAEWGGGEVGEWDISSGRKLRNIPLPCKNVTSTCFGGMNGDTLFIATAKSGQDDPEPAGGIFKIIL